MGERPVSELTPWLLTIGTLCGVRERLADPCFGYLNKNDTVMVLDTRRLDFFDATYLQVLCRLGVGWIKASALDREIET